MFDYIVGTALLRALFGPDVHTETFQRRLGLICLVIISLLVTGLGYFRGPALEAARLELAADGATARGEIVDKKDGWNRTNRYYDFVVEYTAADQTPHRKVITTQEAEYNSKGIGSRVDIRYIRSRPDTFYLVGDEPNPREIAFMRYILYGGSATLALALGALAMFWGGDRNSNRGGPRPATPPAGPGPSPTISPRLGTDGRPVFGKRG